VLPLQSLFYEMSELVFFNCFFSTKPLSENLRTLSPKSNSFNAQDDPFNFWQAALIQRLDRFGSVFSLSGFILENIKEYIF